MNLRKNYEMDSKQLVNLTDYAKYTYKTLDFSKHIAKI